MMADDNEGVPVAEGDRPGQDAWAWDWLHIVRWRPESSESALVEKTSKMICYLRDQRQQPSLLLSTHPNTKHPPGSNCCLSRRSSPLPKTAQDDAVRHRHCIPSTRCAQGIGGAWSEFFVCVAGLIIIDDDHAYTGLRGVHPARVDHHHAAGVPRRLRLCAVPLCPLQGLWRALATRDGYCRARSVRGPWARERTGERERERERTGRRRHHRGGRVSSDPRCLFHAETTDGRTYSSMVHATPCRSRRPAYEEAAFIPGPYHPRPYPHPTVYANANATWDFDLDFGFDTRAERIDADTRPPCLRVARRSQQSRLLGVSFAAGAGAAGMYISTSSTTSLGVCVIHSPSQRH
ncbi:hypothetical protein C8F01DRAFT_206338 [Mycena amicta]|nr:hypothetical protein C8F01DRAFT_206338 [Mycena amicta]